MVIKIIRYLFIGAVVAFAMIYCWQIFDQQAAQNKDLKLYWFIPDGVRAEPDLFTLYTWAQEGDLPNIKKMMDNGAYGYSIPDYPSHTPVNFASLMTGSHPSVHGVADGTMHIEGYPLSISPVGGFRSNAKKVSPAWLTLEENGMDVFLLSMPGSTPPELSRGTTVRGRWGGWGADFYAVNFQDGSEKLAKEFFSRSARLFYTGPKLTEVVRSHQSDIVIDGVKSFSPVKEVKLEAWDSAVYGFIYDSSNDGVINYDRMAFSVDRKNTVTDLTAGDWSDWLPITLQWRTRDDLNIYTPKKAEAERKFTAIDVPTQFKIKIIGLDADGKFRVRFFYNNLNQYLSSPAHVAAELTDAIGPMVDFADNFPPQLIYYPEDKKTFLEEAKMSFAWHAKAVSEIVRKYTPNVILQNIYTPNQMLTSRWWMGYIDPKSARYNEVTDEERAVLWREVKDMYKQIDAIIGEIMKNADEKTYIVFSSDHGVAPLDQEVYVNNYFAQKGWLSVKYNEENGIYDIDWEKTKVAFLRMDNIYINPDGLGGNWKRGSGEKYEVLRDEVIKALEDLKDAKNISPLAKAVKWEDAEQFLDLPADRVGDLIIANAIGYGWSEEVSSDRTIFERSLVSGYKQGIDPQEKAVWTPFMIMGPKVKKGVVIKKPISHIDQLPTILDLLEIPIPDHVQGKPVAEILR